MTHSISQYKQIFYLKIKKLFCLEKLPTKLNQILPSDKKFGLFFSLIFICLGIYFNVKKLLLISYFFIIAASIFLLLALISPTKLRPLNKSWAILGLILGKISNPIILGTLFYGVITPFSILMKCFGRDNLFLKNKKKCSFWVKRQKQSSKITNFENQF